MQTNRCDVHTFALFLYSSADKEKTMGAKEEDFVCHKSTIWCGFNQESDPVEVFGMYA